MKPILVSLLLVFLASAAYAGGASPESAPQDKAAAPKQPRLQFTQEGKVTSVIDVPGYTYIEVTQEGKTLWLAAQSVEVAKGDVIRFDEGALMADFYSKALNRSFPEILFVSQVAVALRSR